MQSPINIPNGSGAQVRADINGAIESVASFYSGTIDPATMTPSSARPFMLWADTANSLIKQRNADNTSWGNVGTIVKGRFVFDIQGALPKASPMDNKNFYVYRDLAAIGTTANQTGTLKITLPAQATSVLTIVIKGITLANTGDWEAKISAYVGATGWKASFESTTISHNCPFSDVRLGLDTDGKYVILLGNTSTVWSLPRIAITEVRACYYDAQYWGGTWSMSFVTNETGITVNRTPQVKRLLVSGNNVVPNVTIYRDLGAISSQSNAQTGTLKIVLPAKFDAALNITIKGWGSNLVSEWKMEIGGSISSGVWSSAYTPSATVSPNCPFNKVRLALDTDGKLCILLGELTQSLGYPQVVVSEVVSSLGNTTFWGAPWELSFITNETGITVHQTLTPKVLATKDDIINAAPQLAIITGTVAHGGTIPLPSGYGQDQCKWFVSPYNFDTPSFDVDEDHTLAGFTFRCWANTDRIVTALHGFNTQLGQPCTAQYMVIGVK